MNFAYFLDKMTSYFYLIFKSRKRSEFARFAGQNYKLNSRNF